MEKESGSSNSLTEKSMTIHIKHNGRSMEAELSPSNTVRQLKILILGCTDVLPRGQKLIFKGKLLKDEMTMIESGVTHGAKLMLIATQGLHQGDGPTPVRVDAPKVSRFKRTTESATLETEKPVSSLPKTQLERWKATGIIALSHCDLTGFPEEVWTCGSSARVLDVSSNSLKEVPYKVGSLDKLQKLNLNANGLLDDSISWEGLAMLKSLTILSLNQNLLTSLPCAFGILGNLKQLDISHNKLTSVPDEIGLLTRLEVLQASNNRISYISQSIGTCISLIEVNLSFNLLGELPATFGELKDLKVLYLRNNALKTLPSTLFKNCLQLSTLDLHNTEITNDLLRQFEGWAEFDKRRCLKHQKQLDFHVISSAKFDEGADRN